ncbi:MAG TPA: dTMP kinase [Spirochaetes bacterium]|nr:dTMP kinase [Spirochaetota bacterium]
MKPALPLFIVFEGIDGSGKSTLCARMVSYFRERGVDALGLREPTDGRWGKELRDILKGDVAADARRQTELFLLDRQDDVERTILPALAGGRLIFMDRYYFSNAAYQGAMGIPPRTILEANRSLNFPEPDRVYFIEVSPELALQRVSSRGALTEESIFEKKDFLRSVREIYHSIADERFLFLDGTRSVDDLRREVVADMEKNFHGQ